MSAFAWACISEGLNPEPHAFYRVYQARHTPTYDHENHLSPCFGVVGFEAREGFLTPLGSFDPPPFDEWVKDWFYYKYLAIDFYTGKATGIWITNDLEPPQNGFISQCVDAFRRVSQRMTLRDILEECFAAGVLPLARSGWRPSSFGRNKFGLRMPVFPSISGPCFNLWSPQDRVTSFLGKFSQKEWVESTRRGIGSSTVEMDPSLAVVTPDVESIPRNAEIPSPPGSLLVPTYSLIFEEPSPDAPSNSAVPPVVPGTACGSSSLIPSEGLQRSPTVASDVVCTDGIAKRLRVLLNLLLVMSNLSGDVLFRSLVAHQVKSIILTRACAREFQDSSGDLLLASYLQASLSAKDDSLKASSAAMSDLLAEVEVLRSHKSNVISDLSILEEKIREKKASLEKEKLFNEHLLSRLSKASQLKISSVDSSFAKSLALCDLGAKYDEVPADASLEVLDEWLRLNLAGLAEICRSFSYDAVVLMIRDLLHSFSCEALWDRLPRGIVKDLTRHGYKRGDALPQDLVDHFDELDRLSVRNAIVEVPPQPVPLAIVPPDVIIISDDECSEGRQVRPSLPVGVASRTRSKSKK
ncbi:hypothetical protein EJB05_02562, partial [Eragrostis curvula]